MGEDHDHDDGEDGEAVFIPLTALDPAAIHAAMQEARDKHQMETEVFRHEIRDFLNSLTPEHMAVLRRLFASIAAADEPMEPLNFYEGILVALLDFKHNVCIGCGLNHEEEILNQMHEEIKGEEPSE